MTETKGGGANLDHLHVCLRDEGKLYGLQLSNNYGSHSDMRKSE